MLSDKPEVRIRTIEQQQFWVHLENTIKTEVQLILRAMNSGAIKFLTTSDEIDQKPKTGHYFVHAPNSSTLP